MDVVWTEHATNQLRAIHDYIARDSPVYATRVVDRLTSRTRQIGEFPRSGRKVPGYDSSDVREIIEPPYRIIYRLRADCIEVVMIHHSSQQPPDSI